MARKKDWIAKLQCWPCYCLLCFLRCSRENGKMRRYNRIKIYAYLPISGVSSFYATTTCMLRCVNESMLYGLLYDIYFIIIKVVEAADRQVWSTSKLLQSTQKAAGRQVKWNLQISCEFVACIFYTFFRPD